VDPGCVKANMAALTLTALLDHATEQHGENLALIASGGPHLTHRELHGAIEKAAAQLRRAGVKPGDLVSLAFPNSLEVFFSLSFLLSSPPG
jgi:non-ribosomal peptide synthetase component E (peptide arylation enzyme)